ncbi:MAG TPA: S8 family serine peptidase, partial [Pyrinomonadaceae bacterium]|nr:S8 family serine peptidase [Pyrinomonadaceae bacterium]
MNRNNFLPHVALALVIVLIAAFAGQVRKWRNDWHAHEGGVKTRLEARVDSEAHRRGQDRVKKGSELFVRFRPGVSNEQIQAITGRLHDRIEDQIESVSGLDLIEDDQGTDVATLLEEYSRLPEVEYVDEIYKIQADGLNPVLPNDPRFDEQWALANNGQNGGTKGADISATRAWATTKGSDKVIVAVLDSGVDYTHRDLAMNIWTRPENIKEYEDKDLGAIDDVHGYNALDNDGDPMDENGHGTHCAGIIGAEGGNNEGITGVNWNVKIMPLKFMDASGSGTTKDAIEAINYVIDRKKAGVNVRIISASWGSTQKSRALEDVISKAKDAGILFVAASGNSSADTDRTPHYPSSYNLGNVISVAALDRNDELTSFSNYGAKSVHIAAPGKDILSTWLDNDFREASGTSMATPVVAGVAALVLSKNPNLSVDDLRKRLL